MWSVHTAANMQKIGIPTATIATGGFAVMGKATAKVLGFDSLPIVAVPHLLDRMTEDEVEKAAESVVDEIIYVLTDPTDAVEKKYRLKHP